MFIPIHSPYFRSSEVAIASPAVGAWQKVIVATRQARSRRNRRLFPFIPCLLLQVSSFCLKASEVGIHLLHGSLLQVQGDANLLANASNEPAHTNTVANLLQSDTHCGMW